MTQEMLDKSACFHIVVVLYYFYNFAMIKYTGCINKFVEVKYNSAVSTITCTFRETTVSSNVCFVNYGECQNLMFTSNGSTSIHNNDIITLRLQLSGMDQVYCYVVTASNGVHTIVVEGEIHCKCMRSVSLP